jgi:hypothetical protein
MKKLGLLLLPILAITLMLGGSAFAQNVGDNSVYFVTYYSNANTPGAPDGTLRIIHDGSGEYVYLSAAIYVFDDSQEMISCCGCFLTADGLLSESVNKELTSDTFTGRGELTRGVIKVISSTYLNTATVVTPQPALRGWMTHIEATTTTFPSGAGSDANAVEKGPWFVTEDALADSNLTALEESNLEALCSYGLTIGSGYGQCPCTPEEYDF